MYFLSVNRLKPDLDQNELKMVIPQHIEWIKEMIKKGRIVLSGKWGNIGGMLVQKSDEIHEAESFIREDPLVKSGLVDYEIDQFFSDFEL